MLEKEIEEKLVEKVRGLDGLCLKFTSPSLTGVPDRMILLPRGKIGFVEVKRKGQRPRKIQELRIKQLKDLGFLVFVLDDREKIEEILDEIQAT
ncbi:VRR-NUC domain-containing protein [Allofustis seminis]|uniref:VRR-NUC domain-containing protein n=1 Tax=Allofustis seminis TaxID=166939 RepID=UPI00037F82E8|nr:VRR-NUC domain-containing protein [Allofustis seminis]